ncbi:MAG: hypothetical protein ACR2MY_01730 [Candidatus Dormibacteria bacterium]
MDPEAPRTLGDLEDSAPERRAPGRQGAVKKSLDAFLEEFEARLREHPGEAATSASAALEGRADGSWRTPVEGGERLSRRLPRRAPWRHPEAELPPAAEPGPVAVEPASELASAGPVMATVKLDRDDPATTQAAASPAGPLAAAADTAVTSKRKNRNRRRHRHR